MNGCSNQSTKSFTTILRITTPFHHTNQPLHKPTNHHHTNQPLHKPTNHHHQTNHYTNQPIITTKPTTTQTNQSSPHQPTTTQTNQSSPPNQPLHKPTNHHHQTNHFTKSPQTHHTSPGSSELQGARVERHRRLHWLCRHLQILLLEVMWC